MNKVPSLPSISLWYFPIGIQSKKQSATEFFMNSSWNYDQNSALPYTLYNVNIAHSKEFAVNQGKYQNFNPSVPPYKSVLIFMEIKQFFEEKKIKMANSKN